MRINVLTTACILACTIPAVATASRKPLGQMTTSEFINGPESKAEKEVYFVGLINGIVASKGLNKHLGQDQVVCVTGPGDYEKLFEAVKVYAASTATRSSLTFSMVTIGTMMERFPCKN